MNKCYPACNGVHFTNKMPPHRASVLDVSSISASTETR